MTDCPRPIVILPCYNELENIGLLVTDIFALNAGFHILVIDDNSPDGTGDLVASMQSAHPDLHLLRRPGKLGLGTAYQAGFRFALERGYNCVVTMDADFSHQPQYLPELVAAAADADLVIGSRYTPGGGAVGWPLRRKIVSGFANYLAHTVADVSARDCTSGFRCYRSEALRKADPDTIISSGYSFLVEMLHRVENSGLRVREIPIIFVDRVAGKSKINRIEVYKTLVTLGRLRFPGLPWERVSRAMQDVGEPMAVVLGLSVLMAALMGLRRRR